MRWWHLQLKDTDRENAHSIKRLTKSMNMYIWASGTLSQIFMISSYTPTKFSKK